MRCSSRFLLISLASLLVLSGCGSAEVIEQQTEVIQQPTTASTSSPTAVTRSSTTTTEAEPSTTTAPTSSTTLARPPLVDGLPAPDITFELDDESSLRLGETYEPVVVFFWATWCHNCHEMMPLIDQMAADFEGRAAVVTVARQSTLPEIETDVIEYFSSGFTKWMSDDDGALSDAFRIPGVPVTVLVVGGVEADRWLGLTDVIKIRNRLDSVLALYG
ncbi:MAG: thioredoxin-like domain-containing protein [Acidimicrobiia bacterium]|nr:thioredoxin-like domain-containing protein [Acidimicrobiia bacterium]